MSYTCSVCRQTIEGDIIVLKGHTDQHIIELVKTDHPEWVEDNGICQKCVDYYRSEINGSVFKDAACVKRKRFGQRVLNGLKNILKWN